MADRCIIEGCSKGANFLCSCGSDIKLCWIHLVPHKKAGGDHIEEVLISERREVKSELRKQSKLILRKLAQLSNMVRIKCKV